MSSSIQHIIERVRSQLSVTQHIGKYVRLTRKGPHHVGCCPFHNEKTGSFTVTEHKGFYYCFGCGASGDAIKFTSEFEKISYRDALKKLAEENGIPFDIDPVQQSREAKQKSAKDGLLHKMDMIVNWFHMQLYKSPDVMSYLAQRGIDQNMIRDFKLGFNPPQGFRDYPAINDFLKQQNINHDDAVKLGLFVARKEADRPIYDRFQGRLIFPIFNEKQQPIALGGRLILPDQNGPKYLNSSETILFEKKKCLYMGAAGLKAIRQQENAILVEGYMDVIALEQSGIPYAAAPLGTAISEMQLQYLWRQAPQITACLDGDAAGMGAAMRCLARAMPHLTPARRMNFMIMPDGHDPDSYIRQKGQDGFHQLAASALGSFEFLWHFHHQKIITPKIEQGQSILTDDIALLEHECKNAFDLLTDSIVRKNFADALYLKIKSLRWQVSRQNDQRQKPRTGYQQNHHSYHGQSRKNIPSKGPDNRVSNLNNIQYYNDLYMLCIAQRLPSLFIEKPEFLLNYRYGQNDTQSFFKNMMSFLSTMDYQSPSLLDDYQQNMDDLGLVSFLESKKMHIKRYFPNVDTIDEESVIEQLQDAV